MTEDAMELNAEGIFQTEIQLQGITSTLEWLSSRVSVICVKKYICLQCLHSEHFFKVVEKDFFLLEHFAQEGWSPGYFFCCIIYVHLYLKNTNKREEMRQNKVRGGGSQACSSYTPVCGTAVLGINLPLLERGEHELPL